MEAAIPFFVVLAAFLGTAFLGLFGWALNNAVRMGRIAERLEQRLDESDRRHTSNERRLDRLEDFPHV